jgi:CubicO group peptidase (beta-lactamase class C family)
MAMRIAGGAYAFVVAGMLALAVPVMADEPLPRAKPEDVGMSSERLARIATTLNADVERGRIPGAVIAVARKGKLVYFEAVGWRDKQAGVKMTTDTIFSIASMTKPMVTVGALMLVEEGGLSVGDPVSKYLPQFATMQVAELDASGDTITGKTPAKKPITIRDLMIHTSGLVYGGRGTTAVHKLYPAGSGAAAMTLTGQEFLDKLGSAPLLWQPGTVWDYGFGLDVLGLLIERVSEQSLGAYLKERLWQPLGMADTGFVIPPEKAARYAKALPNDPDTGKPQKVEPDATKPTKFECGGGCAASTASDYLRFATMLMDKGKLGDKRIVGRKTAEYMLSNQLGPEVKNLIGNADPTRADYGFGLGLAVRTTPGVVRLMGSVGDFSWPGASGTNWWADPKEELVVVFMAHSPGPTRWHYRQVINAMVYEAIED